MSVGIQDNRLLLELNPLDHIVAVEVFKLGPVSVSNHSLMVTLSALLLMVTLGIVLRSPKLVPTRLQSLFESICLFIREDVARPVLHEHTDRYIGFLWTIFYFILTMNLLSMIPVDKIIYLSTGAHHWGGSATANIWITGGLALVVFCATHVVGIREQGLRHYLVGLAPPAPVWLLPLIYPLELISHLVRPFTLAIRLFANIVAGHMVLATVLGLILIFQSYLAAVASVLGAVALSFLELLVAFIQAYIFTFLSTLYIGGAVSPEH